MTTAGDPYVWATAATPDGEAATVWAWVTGLTINPGTTNATTFNEQRCSHGAPERGRPHAHARVALLGAEMGKVGVGQQIDCGVTYTAPGTYALSVSVTWEACWARGLADGGRPAGQVQAGARRGQPGGRAPPPPHQVTVREIQSVNNG